METIFDKHASEFCLKMNRMRYFLKHIKTPEHFFKHLSNSIFIPAYILLKKKVFISKVFNVSSH